MYLVNDWNTRKLNDARFHQQSRLFFSLVYVALFLYTGLACLFRFVQFVWSYISLNKVLDIVHKYHGRVLSGFLSSRRRYGNLQSRKYDDLCNRTALLKSLSVAHTRRVFYSVEWFYLITLLFLSIILRCSYLHI